eukprot:IDg8146t1
MLNIYSDSKFFSFMKASGDCSKKFMLCHRRLTSVYYDSLGFCVRRLRSTNTRSDSLNIQSLFLRSSKYSGEGSVSCFLVESYYCVWPLLVRTDLVHRLD